MFSKILSGTGDLIKGVGDFGENFYDKFTPAGLISNAFGVDTNPFKIMGFGGGEGGSPIQSASEIARGFGQQPQNQPMRQMPQGFGQQQGGGLSQALSGNMSPMQLQGMSNIQPYQPTMTNPQYPDQEFITGNPMLYR